jgi:multidrug efflux pump subunit AcrB
MIGVKPTLVIVGVNFGFMLVLGLLVLTGIVVNIAIILINTVLVKIKVENYSLITAIELATKEKFRPVLLSVA